MRTLGVKRLINRPSFAILICPAAPTDCVQFMWSSYSTAPAVVPTSNLFYTTPISGSPYNVTVVPGAAAYPYTEAYGEGVVNASAGVSASFVIQARVRLRHLLHLLQELNLPRRVLYSSASSSAGLLDSQVSVVVLG